jgi:hypothetical protein
MTEVLIVSRITNRQCTVLPLAVLSTRPCHTLSGAMVPNIAIADIRDGSRLSASSSFVFPSCDYLVSLSHRRYTNTKNMRLGSRLSSRSV